MKILVIEDEPDLLQNIVRSLQKEKYTVESASTYLAALDKIILYDYSCILLDITLPDGSGIELLKELKRLRKSDGVIIISAKNSLDDKVLGLELGADDYLAKPFHLAELTARVKAMLRRQAFDGQNTLQLNNLLVKIDERSVLVNDEALTLNRKEYDMLLFFIENKNRLVSKSSLAGHVWGDHTDEADNLEFVYSQIKNLRKKLKDSGAALEIQAVYGVGYKLVS